MRELFADVPEACDNTLEIVKRIDIKIPEKVFCLPDYPVPRRLPTHRRRIGRLVDQWTVGAGAGSCPLPPTAVRRNAT